MRQKTTNVTAAHLEAQERRVWKQYISQRTLESDPSITTTEELNQARALSSYVGTLVRDDKSARGVVFIEAGDSDDNHTVLMSPTRIFTTQNDATQNHRNVLSSAVRAFQKLHTTHLQQTNATQRVLFPVALQQENANPAQAVLELVYEPGSAEPTASLYAPRDNSANAICTSVKAALPNEWSEIKDSLQVKTPGGTEAVLPHLVLEAMSLESEPELTALQHSVFESISNHAAGKQPDTAGTFLVPNLGRFSEQLETQSLSIDPPINHGTLSRLLNNLDSNAELHMAVQAVSHISASYFAMAFDLNPFAPDYDTIFHERAQAMVDALIAQADTVFYDREDRIKDFVPQSIRNAAVTNGDTVRKGLRSAWLNYISPEMTNLAQLRRKSAVSPERQALNPYMRALQELNNRGAAGADETASRTGTPNTVEERESPDSVFNSPPSTPARELPDELATLRQDFITATELLRAFIQNSKQTLGNPNANHSLLQHQASEAAGFMSDQQREGFFTLAVPFLVAEGEQFRITCVRDKDEYKAKAEAFHDFRSGAAKLTTVSREMPKTLPEKVSLEEMLRLYVAYMKRYSSIENGLKQIELPKRAFKERSTAAQDTFDRYVNLLPMLATNTRKISEGEFRDVASAGLTRALETADAVTAKNIRAALSSRYEPHAALPAYDRQMHSALSHLQRTLQEQKAKCAKLGSKSKDPAASAHYTEQVNALNALIAQVTVLKTQRFVHPSAVKDLSRRIADTMATTTFTQHAPSRLRKFWEFFRVVPRARKATLRALEFAGRTTVQADNTLEVQLHNEAKAEAAQSSTSRRPRASSTGSDASETDRLIQTTAKEARAEHIDLKAETRRGEPHSWRPATPSKDGLFGGSGSGAVATSSPRKNLWPPEQAPSDPNVSPIRPVPGGGSSED